MNELITDEMRLVTQENACLRKQIRLLEIQLENVPKLPTRREVEVMARIRTGENFGQIAAALGISLSTVAAHVYRARKKEKALK